MSLMSDVNLGYRRIHFFCRSWSF